MSRRKKSPLQRFEGMSDLEKTLHEGGSEFNVTPVSLRVKDIEWVINGHNDVRHYSLLVFPEKEEKHNRRKVAYVDLHSSMPFVDKGDIFMGYVVQPKEPFLIESTSGTRHRYAIGGGLSQDKKLLDTLLEKEGFYERTARVMWDAIVSKVMGDLKLHSKKGGEIAVDLVRMAFYKQYDTSYKPNSKNGILGFLNGDIDKQVKHFQNKPLSKYLEDIRQNITLYITLDHKYVNEYRKPGITRFLPLDTYQNRVQKWISTFLGPPQYLTPSK